MVLCLPPPPKIIYFKITGQHQVMLPSLYCLTKEIQDIHLSVLIIVHDFLIWDLKLFFPDKFVSKKKKLVWEFHSNYVCLSLSDFNIKVLEDQFDELIVETATRRKQWPKKILVHAIQTMKAEQEMLVSNLRLPEYLCIKKSIIQCWPLSSFPWLLLILYHKMELLFFINCFCSN